MQCTSCHNKSALVSSLDDAPVVTLVLTTTITCTLGHVTRVPVSRAANTGIFRPNKYLRWSFLITPDLGHTCHVYTVWRRYSDPHSHDPMLSNARCGQYVQCRQCGHDPAAVCHMSTVHSHLSVQISGCKYPLTAGTSDPTRGSQLRSKIV